MLREDLKYITTEHLRDTNQISVRTANCCKSIGLDSLYKIILYFEGNGSFFNKKIKKAGQKTYEELDRLCEKYIAKIEMSVDTLDDISEEERYKKQIKIKELIESDFMITTNNQIINAKDILSYLIINRRKFPIEKHNKIKGLIESSFFNVIDNQLIDANDLLNYITDYQKSFLKEKYNEFIVSYSARIKNKLQTMGFEEFVNSYLLQNDKKLLKIKNIGKKSLEEVIEIKDKIKNEFLQLISLSEENRLKLDLIYQKDKTFQNDFVDEFHKIHNHLPMLWVLEQKLKKDDSTENIVFIHSLPIFQNQQLLTRQELAVKFDKTSERIRQILSKRYNNNEINFEKIIDIRIADWAYAEELIQNTHFVSQVPYDIQNYLIQERCTFSVEFVLQIIAYIFRNKFTLYSDFGTNNRSKSWKSTYLIKKEFTDIFDFEKMKEEFFNKLVDSTTDYLLDIDNYIANSQSWKQFDFGKTGEIKSIVKDILLHEFGLYSEDIEGNSIIIPANKERNPFDVIHEILKINGAPMHLADIFIEFKKNMPKHKYTQEDNAERIRPYLQKHNDITFRKRSSIFLLKEWKHIRSGTIRDVIKEFLLAKDLPQTVENITEYTLQYFPETNQTNIHSTMFSGKNFIQFKNGLFGLTRKEYPSEYEIIEKKAQRKSFEQRLMDFEKYIIENEHFPFSSSQNKEEVSLGQWWNRVVNDKQTISQTQQEEVERIKTTYANFEIDWNAYEWALNCNKFKMFILENRRVPSASGDEKFLYNWLKRAKDDFFNYRLSEEQRKKYIELAKMI
ncbi:MAG: hypothetical protein LBE91_02165 [Tannerella sp.]|jgi:hypothetical protein|nr:hypothetical protein [Tannerella sp.]